jgi:hypothetical protein
VARLKKDGRLAFANFPGFGSGLSKVFVINAMAELPTTGFVVAGSALDLLAPDGTSAATTSIFVAGLDAIGRSLWAKRYVLAGHRSADFAGLHLTDDGGVVVASVAAHAGAPGAGLWAMKAWAKDGGLGGAPGVTEETLAVTNPACAAETTPWNAVVESTPAETRSVATLSEDAGVRVE